jgi:hypothetical protein
MIADMAQLLDPAGLQFFRSELRVAAPGKSDVFDNLGVA